MSYFDDASLVLIPSGYKDQKIFSVKPLDGSGDLAFSRASSATRVASNGLIEKVRTNLCLQSQTIDNATSWSNTLDTGATITVTANYGTAPDGTTTADRIQMALNGGAYAQRNQSITLAAGGEYTYSVYLKSLSGTPTVIFFYDNVNNKTATLTNDWVRYTWTFTSTGNVIPRFVLEAGTSTSADFLAWGCQLETGVATDYIATTSAAVSVGPVSGLPRLDYLNSTCPRLLLEPQRSSLITYSESFDNAAWSKDNSTATANQAVSPDGYTNADLFYINSAGNVSARRIIQSATVSSGTTYTSSVFVKSNSARWLWFPAPDASSANHEVWFDLQNGVVGTVGSSVTGTSIVSYGNGWYRCSVTSVATSTTNYVIFAPVNANGSTTTVSGSSNALLIYGAGLEAGAYATSYIPTLGASVTRVADECSKSSISSFFGSSFTLFVDAVKLADDGPTRYLVAKGTGGFYANFIGIEKSNEQVKFSVNNGSAVNQVTITSGNYSVGQRLKMAARCQNGSYAFYINGVQIGTNTAAFTPSVDKLDLHYSDYYGNNSYSQVMILQPLTNAQLAELTTL